MGNVNMEASQINYRGGEKKMSVEEALKNTSGEAAAIAQLQEDVANLNGSKANRVDIATEFSDLTNYNAGDLVYYEGDLYEFQVDHIAGSWETSEVIQKDLSDIITTLKSGLISAVKVCHITVPVDKTDVSGFLGYVLASIINNQEIGTYVVDGVWEGHDYYTGIVYKWASDSSFGFIEYGVYGGGTQNMVLYTACYKTNVYSNYRSVQYQS